MERRRAICLPSTFGPQTQALRVTVCDRPCTAVMDRTWDIPRYARDVSVVLMFQSSPPSRSDRIV